MFTNLRLQGLKALEKCDLLGLGKINVVCGRNNSGKSTVLEAVTSPKHRSVGVFIGPHDVQSLYETTVNQMGWGGDRSRSESREYERILAAELRAERLLFSDDAVQVTGEIHQAFRRGSLRQWAFAEAAINSWFERRLKDQERCVLIPPKRHLELSRAIDPSQSISPIGEGLLNCLFFAKNQPGTAAETRILEKLRDAFRSISGGYSLDVFMDKQNALQLRFARAGGAWVSAEDCGLGLQDLLVVLYFAIHPDHSVICIEEPESHMHPDMQRKLLAFLKSSTEKQFFLSTHSNVFLNNAFVNRVFFTSFDGKVRVHDATSRASMLDDLGYSVTDNLVSDVVILVEGPTDTPVVEEFLIKRGLLDRFDIRVWPLGGDIMDQVDLSVFAQNYSLIALLDGDPGSDRVRKRFQERCEEFGIEVCRLDRYAIENYFSLEALRRVFGKQVPDHIHAIRTDAKLEDQIGLNVKRSNRKLAQATDLEAIRGSDLDRFLSRVEQLCQEGAGARPA